MKEPRNKKGNPKKFYVQYANARRCSKDRNIDWQFTYDTWEAWWGEDIIKRGPYRGQLVMARFNDVGPYHPDNVKKITCGENALEAMTHRVFSEETREKMRQRMLGNTLNDFKRKEVPNV